MPERAASGIGFVLPRRQIGQTVATSSYYACRVCCAHLLHGLSEKLALFCTLAPEATPLAALPAHAHSFPREGELALFRTLGSGAAPPVALPPSAHFCAREANWLCFARLIPGHLRRQPCRPGPLLAVQGNWLCFAEGPWAVQCIITLSLPSSCLSSGSARNWLCFARMVLGHLSWCRPCPLLVGTGQLALFCTVDPKAVPLAALPASAHRFPQEGNWLCLAEAPWRSKSS